MQGLLEERRKDIFTRESVDEVTRLAGINGKYPIRVKGKMVYVTSSERKRILKAKLPWCRPLRNIFKRIRVGAPYKCTLTEHGLKIAWDRDNAREMVNPGLRRKDLAGSFVAGNVEWFDLGDSNG